MAKSNYISEMAVLMTIRSVTSLWFALFDITVPITLITIMDLMVVITIITIIKVIIAVIFIINIMIIICDSNNIYDIILFVITSKLLLRL